MILEPWNRSDRSRIKKKILEEKVWWGDLQRVFFGNIVLCSKSSPHPLAERDTINILPQVLGEGYTWKNFEMCPQKLSSSKHCACLFPEKTLSSCKQGILKDKSSSGLVGRVLKRLLHWNPLLRALGFLNISKVQVKIIWENASERSSWSSPKGLPGMARRPQGRDWTCNLDNQELKKGLEILATWNRVIQKN